MPAGGAFPYSPAFTMRVHHSDLYHMRGSGIGGIFSSIVRMLVPFAKTLFGVGKRVAASPIGKQVLKSAKRSAVKAGLDLAQDTLAGENVGKSIKRRAKQAGKQMLDDLEAGRGARPRKRNKRSPFKLSAGKVKKKQTKKQQAASMGAMLAKLGL